MKTYILLLIITLLAATLVLIPAFDAQAQPLSPAPTLHPFTPTPTSTPTFTPTPTKIAVTLQPLPTATRIPEKDCSLTIWEECRLWLPIVWKRNQRSGE